VSRPIVCAKRASLSARAPLDAHLTCRADRVEQECVVERLLDEVERTALECRPRRRDVAVRGQDDDRIVEAPRTELRLHVESRAAAHAQVEQYAVDGLRAGPGEERLARIERAHLAAMQA
jgi:hypothetical protein